MTKTLKEHIFLIGFMGVGKTTTSHKLSEKLGAKEVDTDAMIVEKEGKAISHIFEDEGEEYFRKVETETIEQLKQLAASRNLPLYPYLPGTRGPREAETLLNTFGHHWLE